MTDLSTLTGVVRTKRPNGGNPYGIPWSNVTRWEPSFTNASKEFLVGPLLIAAMAVIESDATHYRANDRVITRDDGFGDGLSVGLMQVKPRIWQSLVPDADPYTPEGNIRLGAAIMAHAISQQGSWQKAITNVYFPANDPNGTTQNAYLDTVRSLLAEMKNQLKPSEKPTTTPSAADPIAVIVGGPYPPITYGWLADAGLNYYGYGVNHGTQRATQHTGVDVPVPDETPLYTPISGRVLCVGNAGQNTWGQGCGAYNDTMGGGVGNITILGDTGVKLTLGHCSAADVSVGQRVTAGQRVGRSGGMNGPHVHVETAIERNGTYWLTEPIAALKQAMGAGTVTPQPPNYDAERIDIPQPTEFEGTGWEVTVTASGVPVKQYADPAAPDVARPLAVGDVFTAPYLVYGRDGKPWWISDRRGRVPVAGTRCEELKGVLG